MKKVYGIDLGTTYSAVATLNDSGLPEIIENFADGKPILASAVFFPDGEDPVVGEAAKNQLEVNPHAVIQFVKRQIGKSDAQEWEFDGVKYDPITISALILKRMVEYAADQGHDVKDVVITCPAYFGNEERNATRQAGQIAGLNVLDIVNEPTAAAFNYLAREFKESRKIMIYDLGGGTFDITLFDFSVEDDGSTVIDVIRSGGNDKLGGADWDNRLFNYIADLYVDEVGSIERSDLDKDGELKQKIRTIVETTKIGLTGMKNRSFTINHDGDTARLEVTRDKFEEITSDLLARTIDYVNSLLSDSDTTPDQVDIVLLVGGSTKMPMVKAAVEAVFPNSQVRFEEPDLAVAKGAALAAAVEGNRRIENYIASKESGGSADESLFDDGIETIFDEDELPKTVEEAKALMHDLPQSLGQGTTTIIDKLSRSFGPAVRCLNTNNFIVDNLLFVWDKSPSEASQVYRIPTNCANLPEISTVDVPIYENTMERDEDPIIISDMYGNEVYNDPALLLKKLGEITIEIPSYTSADALIEFTIRARGAGLDVVARNPDTNQIFEADFPTEHTKSAEEMAEAIAHVGSLTTKGDH